MFHGFSTNGFSQIASAPERGQNNMHHEDNLESKWIHNLNLLNSHI